MAGRSYKERIAELQKRRSQLRKQEKDLQQRARENERKKRTQRLIEIVGIAESVLGREFVDEDKLRFLHFLQNRDNVTFNSLPQQLRVRSF